MGVAVQYRRHGIGRRLARTLVEHVLGLNKRLGENRDKFTTVQLTTTAFQINAMRMYERVGWVKTTTTIETEKFLIAGGLFSPRYTFVIQHMELDLATYTSSKS